MISYLQIENITKSFGDLALFDNISFLVAKYQKIALVARNGAGKSTLFNILCGKDSPDSGSVSFIKDISIGFLGQDPAYDENNTVFEQVFQSSGEMTLAIADYEKSLLSGDTKALQSATEKMDALNAWDYELKIHQILDKLKITGLDNKMGTLSGGQRKRVALANALIREPDLLILDEPTNHLDLEMIEWLEEYLSKPAITLLMVTHDRYFLDRICDEILEIDNRQLFRYKGNYTNFLEKRQERLFNESQNVDKARNLLVKELDWIRRMPKARTHKSKSRIESFYELKEEAKGRQVEKQININVHAQRLGTKIVHARSVSKSYDNKAVISNFSYNFIRNERVGFIGNNGTGKTTLLNMITGSLMPDKGEVEIGETVKFGYYRQEGITFDNKMKVIEVMQDIAEVVTLGDGSQMGVSQFLNYFLFPPLVQNSFISKLSGGEKRRLYLATVLMRNPNFLILDEPTNDLDILTLNVLEEYLLNFKGCVAIASHDRYFLDKLVDHLFVFKGDGVISDFPGNYTDYRYYISKKGKDKRLADKTSNDKTIINNPDAAKKKFTFKEQKEYDHLTKEIHQLEEEMKRIEESLGSGTLNHEEIVLATSRFGELMKIIDTKSNRWIELSEKVKN